jgi:hypothetical protein
MRPPSTRYPTDPEFLFELEPEPTTDTLTSYGGVPLLVRACRSLGVPASVARHVHVKKRSRGYDEATMIESLVILHAVGGDNLEDLTHLREDAGLPEMVGHQIPSPEAARQFLYQCHDDRLIAAAQAAVPAGHVVYIPEETAALAGLGTVNREVVQEVGRRCPDQRIATIDLDATVIESHKREALVAYTGDRGYQPQLAVWAELDLVVADQFRDGNVGARYAPLSVAQAAFAALPETVHEYYFRGDSACYEQGLLHWLTDPARAGGPVGPIGFAVSAMVSVPLRAAITALPAPAWQPYGTSDDEVLRSCADVVFVPEDIHAPTDARPLRYVAVRIERRQGTLFADGTTVKYFAVATNLEDWAAPRLLEWHREKAGTIEHVHHVLKNELGAGVLPCGRFGANAAWFRLAVLTHNLLTALKRLALPPELLTARPKRLRFLILQTAGRLIHHARRTRLRLALRAERFVWWREAWASLLLPVPG